MEVSNEVVVNTLFKLAITMIAIWFVWVYHQDTLNGRYKPFAGNPVAHIVLDGRTGMALQPELIRE